MLASSESGLAMRCLRILLLLTSITLKAVHTVVRGSAEFGGLGVTLAALVFLRWTKGIRSKPSSCTVLFSFSFQFRTAQFSCTVFMDLEGLAWPARQLESILGDSFARNTDVYRLGFCAE